MHYREINEKLKNSVCRISWKIQKIIKKREYNVYLYGIQYRVPPCIYWLENVCVFSIHVTGGGGREKEETRVAQAGWGEKNERTKRVSSSVENSQRERKGYMCV